MIQRSDGRGTRTAGRTASIGPHIDIEFDGRFPNWEKGVKRKSGSQRYNSRRRDYSMSNHPSRVVSVAFAAALGLMTCLVPTGYSREYLTPTLRDGKWGFKDEYGKLVIPAQYDDAVSFREGIAPVAKARKWGFVDLQGKVVVPLQYDWTGGCAEGLAIVKVSGGTSKPGKWIFVTRDGKPAFKQQFDNVGPFCQGLAPVTLGGKSGFIDKA